MPTTDDHSPINRAVGIPERSKYEGSLSGAVYECLICQEKSPFADNANPGDMIAYMWALEHTKTHPGTRPDFFVWTMGRTRVKIG